MVWWQIILVVSAVSFWTLAAVSFGFNMAGKIHYQHVIAEQAKWRIPDTPGQN